MNSNFISARPAKVFISMFCILLALLVVLEGWRYMIKPSLQNKDTVITKRLEQTAASFVNSQEELMADSRKLATTLQSQIEQGNSQSDLFESLQSHPDFWGSALFIGNQPIVWNDFSLDPFRQIQLTNQTDSYVEVRKNNNVTYWLCHIGFTIQTEDGQLPYHLYAATRIQQTNALPFANESEFSILDPVPEQGFYSLNISIYNPLPTQNAGYRVLKTLDEDSVGTVYATTANVENTLKSWHSSNRFWRAVFALLCFVLISISLYYRVDSSTTWKSLPIQLFIIGIGWLVFVYISLSSYWIPTLFEGFRPADITSYQMLYNFSIDGIFFLLISFTILRKLKGKAYPVHSTWFLSSIFAAFFVGLINMSGIIFVFQRCYQLASTTAIPLLTLQIFPGLPTILFYLAFGVMLLALAIALLALNRFLLRSCRNQSKLAAAICIASFVISLFIAQLFISDIFGLNWSFIVAIIFFGAIFGLSFLFFNFPYIKKHSSPLRNAALASLILSVAGSTLIYHAQMSSKNEELVNIKQTYLREQNEGAPQLITNLLTNLETEFTSLTEQDLENRISFIEARFTQTIETTLNQSGLLYLFDVQLIKPNLEVIADYSTDLNSPDWVNTFDLRRLEAGINIFQITKNNVRPVVQQPELIDGENYQTFSRGWIPIFGVNETEPVAWILCSVYQERPNFDKPMRAVMAAVSYQDWNKSFAVQQYENNRLQQVFYQGVGGDYPIYNILQPAEVRALQQDSAIYYTSTETQNSYRNFLSLQPDGQTVKVTTILPDYQNILFSFFRLSFTLLLAGFLMLMLHQYFKHGRIIFFGKNEQFQYRILDSFLLATLVFLIMLVFVTHYAIKQQNKDLVQQQLFEKLESITNATENNAGIQRNLQQGIAFSLDSLTTPLNVDASFYSNGVIKKSTTPQIYQQHLLPSTLPFPIYRDLFQSQKRDALTTVMLNNQDLLIGYRSILSGEGDPIAAIAIPTFLQSPKYDRQLLETTSYLIILYLVVFGIFILGTTFISRQLTRPLQHIREGLNKISKGNLDTNIPVTSEDEIGGLAIAYNQMVARLKELQEELAVAEREAAWQEMAQQVAHEIKNPLTPMKLNIQHLERQLASGDYNIDELKEKIKTITQNLIIQIQSLSNIASDFSKFSKPIKKEFTAVNINDLIHSITDLYQHDEQIKITEDCTASPAMVYGDADELRRVIINLVKNAREAMPQGGTIHLKTYLRQTSLFIEVEDDGVGIPEDDKAKIFVPNFSTKSSGTGLGLAICKKVIDAHEGGISFASIKNKGTTFVVKLAVYRG